MPGFGRDGWALGNRIFLTGINHDGIQNAPLDAGGRAESEQTLRRAQSREQPVGRSLESKIGAGSYSAIRPVAKRTNDSGRDLELACGGSESGNSIRFALRCVSVSIG